MKFCTQVSHTIRHHINSITGWKESKAFAMFRKTAVTEKLLIREQTTINLGISYLYKKENLKIFSQMHPERFPVLERRK